MTTVVVPKKEEEKNYFPITLQRVYLSIEQMTLRENFSTDYSSFFITNVF